MFSIEELSLFAGEPTYTLPKATTTTLGGVTIDSSSLTVDGNGKIGVDIDKIKSSMGLKILASGTFSNTSGSASGTVKNPSAKSAVLIAFESTRGQASGFYFGPSFYEVSGNSSQNISSPYGLLYYCLIGT